MRTTKELLEVMLENITLLRGGLCTYAWDLYTDWKYISFDEWRVLNDYLHYNLPERTFYFIGDVPRFSFPYGEKEPRIKWLKEQIEKIK